MTNTNRPLGKIFWSLHIQGYSFFVLMVSALSARSSVYRLSKILQPLEQSQTFIFIHTSNTKFQINKNRRDLLYSNFTSKRIRPEEASIPKTNKQTKKILNT